MTSGAEQRSTTRTYWLVGAAVVLLHLAIAVLRTRDAWFFADDFQNLEIVTGPHRPPGQFLETVFGQYAPLYRATNFVMFHLFGLNFAPWLAFLLACSATAVGMLMWLCARMRLPLAATIAIGAFLACTWIPFEGQSWWSAGLHLLPGAAALCACLVAAARPAADLGPIRALVLAAVFGIGVAYYNAVLLVFGPVVVIRWYVRLYEQPDVPRLMRAAGVIADLAPTIAVTGLAIVAMAWLGGDRSSALDPLMVLRAAGSGAVYGAGAGIAGARGFGDTSTTSDLMLWGGIGGAILFATVIISVIRAPRTAWLWAGCFAFIVLQLWIIGNERISTFGVWVVASPRYNLSNVLMFTGTAIIAFSSRYQARTLLPTGTPRLAAMGAGALLAVAIIVSNLVTGISLVTPEKMQASRTFVDHLRSTAAVDVISVGDRTLPDFITPHWTGGYAWLSRFSGIAPVKLRVTSWQQATHFVADDGSVVPITAQPVERWTWPDGRTLDIRVLSRIEAAGEITAVERASYGDRLIGWANPMIQRNAASQIVAVRPDNTTFYGDRSSTPSPDLDPRFRTREFNLAGFEMILPDDTDASSLRIFLVLGEAIAIPLPRAPTFLEREPLPRNLGAPLSIVSATPSETFSENGWFQNAPKPPLPGGGFGSYALHGDAGQGDIVLTLDAPAGLTSIIVPALTGPTSKGMRITIADPANGAIIATLSDPPVQAGWRLWQVALPETFSGKKIEVRVEDHSSEWGAWVAIGPVHALGAAN